MIALLWLLLSTSITAFEAPWRLTLAAANGKDYSIGRIATHPKPARLTPLKVTSHVVTLMRRTFRSNSYGFAQAIRAQAMAAAGKPGVGSDTETGS